MPLIADVLRTLGYSLPAAPTPVSNYVPAVRAGNLLFIAGQICQLDGRPAYLGRLGDTLNLDDGRRASEAAALCVLAQIAAVTDGTIEAVRRVAKLGVFVASTPGFTAHSQAANGASDLMVAVFGEAGRHTRTTI